MFEIGGTNFCREGRVEKKIYIIDFFLEQKVLFFNFSFCFLCFVFYLFIIAERFFVFF